MCLVGGGCHNEFMCVYVSISVCVCAHVYVCMCVCVYVCVCVCVCVISIIMHLLSLYIPDPHSCFSGTRITSWSQGPLMALSGYVPMSWWCHDDVMVIPWWYTMMSWRCQTFRIKAFSKIYLISCTTQLLIISSRDLWCSILFKSGIHYTNNFWHQEHSLSCEKNTRTK